VKRWICLAVVALSVSAVGAGKDKEKKEAAPAAPTAPAVQAKPEPGVNWAGQVLKATGAGAPDMKASSPAQARLGAERAAQMDAFRNLLAQAKGIQINAGKTVGDELANNDEIRGKVEGAIRGFKVAAKRYFSDGGVEVDVEVPLSALTELFFPGAPAATETSNKKPDRKNTGLVVDARGLKVTPALAPRILDDAGKSLYGAEALNAEARKSLGVAAYFQGLDEAKKQVRVGERPLVVKASKADGTDLVLAADDAKKIDGNAAYLAEGRVIIVTQ
jgi:hypothetical protein